MMLKVAKLGIAIAAVLAWIVPAAYAGVPDVQRSFYVPQRGSVGTPTEGTVALSSFRVCPNNDAGVGLAQSARVKVVVRDVNDNPIQGVAAADVCLLFNGGTAAQGFSGVGADSVVANRQWNPVALCPDVRCVAADAATDALGTTYITFIGAAAGTPGVGVRDSFRKWGHYDNEIPVFVLGFKLSGRLTTASANGTYQLRIKNIDVAGGLGATTIGGELVNITDANSFAAAFDPGTVNPLEFWCDFDNSGSVAIADANQVTAHFGHDCDSPTP